MAQVQDGLWALRNLARMVAFAGPAQAGGVRGVISLVLAIVLLVQLRAHQGLPT